MNELSKVSWVLGTVLVLAVAVWADDKAPSKDQNADPAAAAMAEAMKYATPGENHKKLASLEGKWKLATKFHMAPEAPWDESTGECTIRWTLGGRFLEEKVLAPPTEEMPVPFEGVGYIGYDNLAGQFIHLWMDNFMTGVLSFTGSSDDSGRIITLHSEFPNPMKGGALMKARWVYRILTDDKFVFEMWEPDDAGKEYLHGEITYTRVR